MNSDANETIKQGDGGPVIQNDLQQEIDRLRLEQKKMERKIRRMEYENHSLSTMYDNAITLRDYNEREKETQNLYNRLLLEAFPAILIVFNTEMQYKVGTAPQIRARFGFADTIDLVDLPLREIFANAVHTEWVDTLEQNCARVLKSGNSLKYNDYLKLKHGTNMHVSTSISPAFDNCGELEGFVLMMDDISELVRVSDEAKAASQAKTSFLANMSHEIRTPMNAILGMSNLLGLTQLDELQKSYVQNIQKASDSLLNLINDILDFSKIDAQKFELVVQEYDTAELLRDVTNIIGLRAAEKNLSFVTNISPRLPSRLMGDDLRIKQILLNILSNAVKYTKKGFVMLCARFEKTDDGIDLFVQVQDSGIGIKEEELSHLFSAFAQLDLHKNRGIEGTGLGLALSKQMAQAMDGDIEVESVYGEGSTFTLRIPQKVSSPGRIAKIEDPARKNILVFGTGHTAKAVAQMVDMLYLSYTLVTEEADLQQALVGNKYSHLFYEYECGHDLVQKIAHMLTGVACVAIKNLANISKQKTGEEIEVLFEPVLIMDVAQVINKNATHKNDKQLAAELGAFTTKNAKALVVDDNEINLIVAAEMLKKYEIEVDEATSGKEALGKAAKQDYDIVFMDHMMPGMDGIETAVRLRSLGQDQKKVPVIALTANAIVGVRDMFIQAGMNDYLSKPINVTELNGILLQWLPAGKVVRKKPAAEPAPLAAPQTPLLTRVMDTCPIDVPAAVARVGGNEGTYLAILQTLAKSIGKKSTLLRSMKSEEDWEGYRIEVHGQKSALYNVGAHKMSDQARKLELAVHNQNWVYIEENTQTYTQQLQLLGEKLQSILEMSSTPANKEKTPASPEQQAALAANLKEVDELLAGLEADNALSVLASLNKVGYGNDIDSALYDIVDAIQNFDYDLATETIKSILALNEG